MATSPEPGWYDDGTGKQRWWDGTHWTDHYIDLREREIELHTDAAATTAPAGPGWYDDGRGRQRWWDGTRWTNATRFSGSEESFAGVVVDGRWIHFGEISRPVAEVRAGYETGAVLLKQGRLSRPATARALIGSWGLITPHLLKRSVDPQAGYLVVEAADQMWLASVPTGGETEARRFATWINSSADHYRYR